MTARSSEQPVSESATMRTRRMISHERRLSGSLLPLPPSPPPPPPPPLLLRKLLRKLLRGLPLLLLLLLPSFRRSCSPVYTMAAQSPSEAPLTSSTLALYTASLPASKNAETPLSAHTPAFSATAARRTRAREAAP
jgi:hypothetical protein